MTIWTCATCAIEHPDTPQPPTECAICSDERQWVPRSGQAWTTREDLAERGYRIVVGELEPDLYAVDCVPELGIGQRGLLLRSGGRTLLWEPPGFLDEEGVAEVRALGGVDAIASSHPHLTGSSIQWSHAFGGVPVYVARADERWIRRPDPVIELWDDEVEFAPGVRMLACGGHFAGSSVVHWAAGAEGRGVLLTGDTIGVNADLATVSAMRSYPNYIPLPEKALRRILDVVSPLEFDRLYGAFRVIESGASESVARSFERYIAWINGEMPLD